MALSHAITSYGLVTNAQKSASLAIAKAQQNPTAKNILLADTARDRVGEAIDNYNYWITTVPAKDQSKVPPIPEFNPQEYGQLNQQQASQLGVTSQQPVSSTPAAPVTPVTPATPTTPVTPAAPVTPKTPVTPAAPSAPAAPAAPAVPSYVTNPKTDSEYISAVKYYAQKNGLNITDSDIKNIAYAYSGSPNISSMVEAMRGGDLDQSHPFHPKNAAITYTNNKQQVIDDAIKNLTLNVVENQYGASIGGGASGFSDAAVAADNATKQLQEFISNAVKSGLATPDNVQNIVNKTTAFFQDVIDKRAKEAETGLFDKIFRFAVNAGVAVGTGGLSLPTQLAISAAFSLAQGASPADIVRNVVGTIAAAQIGGNSKIGFIDDFNKAVASIDSPELQNAIFNGARQGVYSTVTQQDIAKNIAAGAIAGAIASNIQSKYKDPALSNAAGEFIQAKISGKSDFDAIAAAVSGYASEEEKANAKKVIAEEVSSLPLDQVQALGYKTQDEITSSFFPEEKALQVDEVISPASAPIGSKVGSDLAAVGDIDFTVPSNIANKQEFKTSPGEVGENIIKYTDRDGEVSYRKNVTSTTPDGKKFGYTIVYDDLNGISYEYSEKGKDLTSGVSVTVTKTRPSVENLDTLTKAGVDTTDTSPINLSVKPAVTQTGQGASTGAPTKLDINQGTSAILGTGTTADTGTAAGGVTTTPSESTEVTKATEGTSATGGAGTGLDKDIINLTGIGTGGAGGNVLTTGGAGTGAGTGGTETGTETGGAGEVDGGGGITEDTTVTKPPTEPIILDLISGNNQIKPKTRIPSTAERESLQALSQALRIGDPGEALFGGKLGRRRNVWNEESLRLKDELGG